MGAAQLRRHALYECTPKLAVQPCAEEELLYNGAARKWCWKSPNPQIGLGGKRGIKLFLLCCRLLAFGAEFLALLAMKPLRVRLLRAFERRRRSRFGGFLLSCRSRTILGGR